MDGSMRTAGLGGSIQLGGREFPIRGRTVGFAAAIEAEILRTRGNPTALIVEAARELVHEKDGALMTDLVASSVADKFRNWRFVTWSDYSHFLSSPRGDAFQVWYAIGAQQSGVSLDQVQHWLRELRWNPDGGTEKYSQIITAIDFASGEDGLGNGTGPSTQTGTTAPSTGG